MRADKTPKAIFMKFATLIDNRVAEVFLSATAVASDFKFVKQLGFTKGHHKITPREKSGRGPGLGKFPKISGSPLIFLQRLKLATVIIEITVERFL